MLTKLNIWSKTCPLNPFIVFSKVNSNNEIRWLYNFLVGIYNLQKNGDDYKFYLAKQQ